MEEKKPRNLINMLSTGSEVTPLQNAQMLKSEGSATASLLYVGFILPPKPNQTHPPVLNMTNLLNQRHNEMTFNLLLQLRHF